MDKKFKWTNIKVVLAYTYLMIEEVIKCCMKLSRLARKTFDQYEQSNNAWEIKKSCK